MSKVEFTESDLVACLDPLRDCLDHLVLCGGWTLFVYRKWLAGDGPMPMRTADVDIAVPPVLPDSSASVATRLETAGFLAVPVDLLSNPPVQRFQKEGLPDVEFITSIQGNKTDATVQVQPGLVAQPVRYVEILLDNTRPVRLPHDLEIRVPQPAAYLYQKALSFPRRRDEARKAKDLAYMFELLHNYPDLQEEIHSGLETVRDQYPPKWFRKMQRNLALEFGTIESNGVQLVVEQQPHPYQELLRTEATNGRAIFERTVFAEFQHLLKWLDERD